MNAIVMTTIFGPTEAVRLFAELSGWTVVVSGDHKTPQDWECAGVTYLTPERQQKAGFRLSKSLPWNHYARKMFAYLEAISVGAQVLFDTDDDNRPKANWEVLPFEGNFRQTAEEQGFVNVYSSYSDHHIWPRGFPLERLAVDDASLPTELPFRDCRVGVWQSLADGDPDVDAIYRLTDNTPCYFDDRGPIVLSEGTACPFNSQATAFRQEAFALLYMPATTTMRFTDILRGLVAQPILWAANYSLGFTRPTVVQERHPHDYLVDFESEIPCYLYAQRTLDAVRGAVKSRASIEDNLLAAYGALVAVGIVSGDELALLRDWLHDLEDARRRGSAHLSR